MSRVETFTLLVTCFLSLNVAFGGVSDNTIEQYAIIKDGQTTCDIPDSLVKEISGYQATVNKIFDQILNGKFKGKTWESLAELTDTFGKSKGGSTRLSHNFNL